MKITYGHERKAISPVIATVILIAITLIAAIAIAGFVFGLFGSFTSSAQVTVTSESALAGVTGGTLASTCAAVTTGTAPYVNVVLTNTGTASTTATAISLTTGGHTYTASPGTPCAIGASGASSGSSATVSIVLAVAVSPGQSYTGSVSQSNGGSIPFTGTFG